MTKRALWATSRYMSLKSSWYQYLSNRILHTCIPVVQPWLTKVVEKLPKDQEAEFKTKAQSSIKFLIGKIKDLQL